MHQIQKLSWLFCFLLFTYSSFGQVESLYKIRLAAIEQTFEKENIFPDLRDLGVILFEKTNSGFTRIYLGKYLGASTASSVLEEVKSRGYSTAFIEKDEVIFKIVEDKTYTHTLQLNASETLDLKKLTDLFPKYLHKDIYIELVSGYYKLSLGLFSPMVESDISKYEQLASAHGYSEGFIRKVR